MVKKTYSRKRKKKPEEVSPEGIPIFVQLPKLGIASNCAEAECEAMDLLPNAAESSQHIQQNMQLSGEVSCTSVNSSLVKDIPRRRRSKWGDMHKKVLDVGNGAKHKIALQENSRARQEQICEDVVFIRESKAIPQNSLHCRGQSRRRCKNSEVGKLDTVTLDCYLEKIWGKLPEERRSLFTYLDSFWYYLYTGNTTKAKVLKWIKEKDIFSKTYVFVPIVQWGHWFLLIICNMGKTVQSKSSTPCLLLLDSMQAANAKQLEPGIRKFVFDIYSAGETALTKQMIRKIPLRIPKVVPQQRNSTECGYYVLYYIARFLELAPVDFSMSNGYPYFMKEDWFTPEELDCFYKELKSSSKDSSDSVESSADSGSFEWLDCCIS